MIARFLVSLVATLALTAPVAAELVEQQLEHERLDCRETRHTQAQQQDERNGPSKGSDESDRAPPARRP